MWPDFIDFSFALLAAATQSPIVLVVAMAQYILRRNPMIFVSAISTVTGLIDGQVSIGQVAGRLLPDMGSDQPE